MSDLILKNPRIFVKSARITYFNNVYILNVTTIYGSKSDWYPSEIGAKMAFSKNFLQPKYHGKNIWESE